MRKITQRLGVLLAGSLICLPSPAAQNSPVSSPRFFDKTVRPLLNEYCLKCHSTEKHKGDMDLQRFSSLSEVKKHPKVWQTFVEQLATNEMPPKEKPQPT